MSSDPLPSSRSNYQLVMEYHTTALAGLAFGAITILLHYLHYPYLSILAAGISIALLSLTVSEVAEVLAERLDEPYGSFVLTFTAVIVEIILLFMVLLTASGQDTAAMDTVKGGIISAVIVDMNVLLGLAVFIGGLAFKEQEHNENTSSTYTTILLVATSALLVPSILHFSKHSYDDLLLSSIIIALVLFIFYIIIFIFQTKTHSHFFKATARSRIFRYKRKLAGDDEEESEQIDLFDTLTTPVNFLVVCVLVVLIGVVAEIFATEGMQLVHEYDIPVGLAGLIIAIVSVSPEIVTAVKAAKNDQIQRVVNIAMGASTVSIMLAVPVLMALSFAAGNPLTLDFNTLQIGALILTVVLAWKTTDDGETNYFEGTSHLVFFICYAIVAAFY